MPAQVTISPDGGTLYVSNSFANTLSVLSTATLAVTATVKTGNQSGAIAVARSGKALYVTNQGSSTVSVIAG